tara:strand:+ start:406 stop:654 length:249 start_codon:yes stop_codon:yes gene_type:complete
MIVGKIAKAVFKLIMPDIVEHMMKVFKMDKLVNYMELPNEADRGIEKLKVAHEMVKGEMKDMTNEINKIKNILDKAKKIRSL